MASAVSSGLFGTSTAMLAVKATSLPRSLLRFPPSPIPTALPPPSNQPTLAHPFTIPTNIYNALLSPTVPITFALIYTSVVSYFNNVNAKRTHKPWPSSQTRAFKAFVLVHNVMLAAYSAWTFIGMINALVLSFASLRGEDGLAGVVDSLCKMNGPRGLGSAATYNDTSSAWQITNRAFHLAADGLGPESTDVGRMWNEGLAFYGWLFYLSKFYEVIDTAIILAKGKRSSFLQAYHHAGAMLCMWAGIRYMSPPIWMFVLVNSGIHAIMYTFYFCTAMGVRVPKRLKQILTTMQISQFVIGATYAFAHLFVAYRIPVSVPYIYHLGSAISSAASAASSGASSVGSSAIATASAGAWLKKLALRAAGREALAENVPNDRGQKFGIDAVNIMQDFTSREETRYRDELQWTHCLDTSGQVFAILLNCMYLAPLTWLFARFFVTAYSKRLERRRSSTPSEKAQVAGQGLKDASKGLARQVSDVLDQMHGGGEEDGEPANSGEGVQVNGESMKKTAEDLKNAVQDKISEGVEKAKQLKDELGGGIDPIAYLQNKSAESRQRKSTTPSDAAEQPATEPTKNEEQSPGDGTSAANAGETQKGDGDEEAAKKSPVAESSSEESGKEESVTPLPNEGGTDVDEATGAAKTTDSRQETTDEANEEGKAKDNGREGEAPGGDEQTTASTEEKEQDGSEADTLAKTKEPESKGDDPESQEVPDTPTSDFEHVEKPEDESGDDPGSESQNPLAKENAESPPEKSVNEGEPKSEETPAGPVQGAEDETKGRAKETSEDAPADQSGGVAKDTQAENTPAADDGPSTKDTASATPEAGDAGEESADEAEQLSFIEPEKALAELPKVAPGDAPEATGNATEAARAKASETKPTTQSEEQEKTSISSQQTDDTTEDEKPSAGDGRKADSEEDNVEALPTHVDEDTKKEHEELTRSPSTKSKTSSIKSRTSSIRSKASSIRSRFRRSSQDLSAKHEEGKDKENQTPEQTPTKGNGGKGSGKVREGTSPTKAKGNEGKASTSVAGTVRE